MHIREEVTIDGRPHALELEPASKEEFHLVLRHQGRRRNNGSIVTYDEERDLTYWMIAGVCVGRSEGRVGSSRSYALNALVM